MYVFNIKRNSQEVVVKRVQRQVLLNHSGRRGLQGIQGEQGIQGIEGPEGPIGQGLIEGGLTGQLLAKASNTDYDTEWISPAIFATAAQGALAESALQAGDNISLLNNDESFISNISGFDTDDLAEGSTNLYFTNARADSRITAQKAQADGLATLGSDGKIPTSQLPALAVTDTFVVASQVAMLALSAEVGDVAVRTDENKSYILKTAGASTLANWQELLTPTDAVLSVNGQTGAITLTTSDVAEGTNEYYTDAKVQTVGDARYIRDTGDTMTGKLAFSGISSDFAIDFAAIPVKFSNDLVIDGSLQNFNWPYTRHGLQPTAFIYLDNQFKVFRIGTQKPSAFNTIAFELPVNNEYQDVMSITATNLSPAGALNNTVSLGGTSNRWLKLWLGSNGLDSNGDLLLNSASLELTPAPSADVTESGVIVTLTAAEALAFGDVCYINSDGKMAKADADGIATANAQAMALGTISADATGKFLLMGFVRNDAWAWTVGGDIYLSTTAGGMTQTAPSGTDDVIQVLGTATHADRMIFRPNSAQAVVA